MKKKMYKKPTPHNLLRAYQSLIMNIEQYLVTDYEPLTEEKLYEMWDEAFDHIAFLYKKIPVGQIKGGKK